MVDWVCLRAARKALQAGHWADCDVAKASRKVKWMFVNSKQHVLVNSTYSIGKVCQRSCSLVQSLCTLGDLEGWQAHFDRDSNNPISSTDGLRPTGIILDKVSKHIVSRCTQHLYTSTGVEQHRIAAAQLALMMLGFVLSVKANTVPRFAPLEKSSKADPSVPFCLVSLLRWLFKC